MFTECVRTKNSPQWGCFACKGEGLNGKLIARHDNRLSLDDNPPPTAHEAHGDGLNLVGEVNSCLSPFKFGLINSSRTFQLSELVDQCDERPLDFCESFRYCGIGLLFFVGFIHDSLLPKAVSALDGSLGWR
jgi:hypothetical protein